MQIPHALENALEELTAVARSSPELAQEFAASRAEFFGGAPRSSGPAVEQAGRRHLEWFLFERFSPSLDGVPAERLRDAWSERLPAEGGQLAGALLGSFSGIFEVTGLEPGEGLWIRDLLGGGEYPVHEPAPASAFAEGDVLVGRIFPVGEATFLASPAASCFRNRDLLEALRGDMQALREARRGSLRISQAELERMFHGAGEPPASASAARRKARAVLAEGGVDDDEIDALLETLWSTPFDQGRVVAGVDDVLGELLNRLAFHTEVDLDRARRALLESWSLTSAERGRAAGPAGDAAGPVDSGLDARDALASFDRGRAEGRDLDALFDQLERDLGLEDEAGGGDDEAPDFPGVVGAMVEEFLWETAREEGDEARTRLQPLRGFARYARDIGVFENVTAREVVAFTSVWAIEHRALRTPSEARRLLASVAAFCRWSEREHEVPLWSGFRDSYDRLRDALPRIAAANGALAGAAPAATELYQVVDVRPDAARVLDRGGTERTVGLSPALTPHLERDDLVRARLEPDDELVVAACYPPEARPVLLSR